MKRNFYLVLGIFVILFISCKTSSGIESTAEEVDGMVFVKAGTFTTAAKTDITIDKSFYISKTEVTQKDWIAVMGNNPSCFNGEELMESANNEEQLLRPVEMISWYDAIEYCNKKSELENLKPVYEITKEGLLTKVVSKPKANGYRLPTEAEFEYAAGGGQKNRTNWAGTNELDGNQGFFSYAWSFENSDFMTHQTGIKLPNTIGLFDMSGNVHEWCWDTLDENTDKRVWKGGGADSEANWCAVSVRRGAAPMSKNSFTGFRVVRTAF